MSRYYGNLDGVGFELAHPGQSVKCSRMPLMGRRGARQVHHDMPSGSTGRQRAGSIMKNNAGLEYTSDKRRGINATVNRRQATCWRRIHELWAASASTEEDIAGITSDGYSDTAQMSSNLRH